MPYKSLEQISAERQSHHDRALRLFREAAEIQKKMKTTISITEFIDFQTQWLEKTSQATAEMDKSIELSNQYIQELERLKNRDLN